MIGRAAARLAARAFPAVHPRQIWTLMADPAAPVDVRAVADALRPAIAADLDEREELTR
jgi:hypothetical protein